MGEVVDITTPVTKRKKRAASHATQLVNVVTKNGGELFRSPEGDSFVTVAVKSHRETLSLGSRAFRQYLAREYFLATQKAVTSSAIKDAATILAGSAMLRGDEHPVFNRLATTSDSVVLDLGRADHQVVRVTSTGWDVVPHTDVRFCRRPGGLALPLPVHSDDAIEDLVQRVINVRNTNDTRLLIAWLVAALRGRKPFPILFVKGESGSAKSFGCDLIRRVIDPSQANSSRLPKEARDLMIAARNSFVLSFDNLSFVPDWLSDDLCSLATGAGFRTRALTTDDEETIFSAARPILMNGIPDVITRDDLMSRTIVVALDAIPDTARTTERELDAVFEDVHPRLLGRLLDAVAGALQREASVKPLRLPRMADLAITMTAAEPALGWPDGTFLDLYRDNRQSNTEALLDGNAVYAGILKLGMPWTGQCGDLLLAIRNDQNRDALPKTAKSMANTLRRLVTPLRQVGFDIALPTKCERSGALRGKRLLTIARTDGLPYQGEDGNEESGNDIPF